MMRHVKNVAWFFVGVFVAFVWMVPSAFAQMPPYPSVAGPFSPYPPQFNPYLPNPVSGAPSAASVANATGVAVSQSGTATVATASGVRIPVAVTQTANVAKAAIAKAAGFCFRGPIGVIACAATAAQVVNEMSDRPISICPPPNFFCRKPEETITYPTGPQAWRIDLGNSFTSDPAADCAALWNSSYKASYPFGNRIGVVSGDLRCQISSTGSSWSNARLYSRNGGTCPAGSAVVGNTCVITGPVGPPLTQPELEQTLQEKMDADFQANRRLYDAMKKDQAANPTTYPAGANPITNDTPVTVSAPPVTSPERDVSITNSPKPDGSTDTTTVKEKTTVTPTTSGTTQGDIRTTYPSQTTTTTTVVNNVTNTTNTSSNVTNNAPLEAPATPKDFPNDYNKEVTQQKIAAELAGDGAPALPDMTQQTTEHIDKDKTDLKKMTDDLPSQFTTDKSNWFSWVWTPPVGTCAPSTGSVHGVALSLDICPTVDKIREALGFLFAIFGAWSIYTEIFKRPV